MPGHVGLRRGRDGDGLVHPLRHRPRRRRGRADGRSGRPDHPRRRASSSRGASGSSRRASSRTPTRGRRLRLLGDDGRPRLACPGRGGPAGRLHRQAQRRAQASCRASRRGPGRGCPTISARSTRRCPRTSGEPAYEAARAGELPERLWTELYFQTAHDPSVAPEGVHTMSVFAQYVPHTFARGDWDTPPRRGQGPGAPLDRPLLRQHARRPSSTSRCSARPTSSARSA